MFFLNRLLNKFNRPNNDENDRISLSRKLSALTTQEIMVFMLLREGFSKDECSQRLGVKRRDLNRHIRLIYRKLNVRTNAELIMKYKEAEYGYPTKTNRETW
jgi:DNA-binding NarL/FixJ family response regulator